MFGTLQPWYLIGPWRYFLPVVRVMPIFGNTAFRIGWRSASHCLVVNVVAASRYSTVRIIVVLKVMLAAYRERNPRVMRSYHILTFPWRLLNCSLLLPLGAKYTPSPFIPVDGPTCRTCWLFRW